MQAALIVNRLAVRYNLGMLAKLNTFALVGIDAVPVEVEVDNSYAQMPKTIIVGLPELAVRESVHRIERALHNLRYERPSGRTVVNLAPADLPKNAGAFDLPIALGMLVATGQVRPEQLQDCATVGELALDGSIRPVKGALSMAMEAKARKVARILVPAANAREAAVVEGVDVYGVGALGEAVGLITGELSAEPLTAAGEDAFDRLNRYDVDFGDVRGQEFAKRALVVAAAGGHNVLMTWTINRWRQVGLRRRRRIERTVECSHRPPLHRTPARSSAAAISRSVAPFCRS